MELKTHAPVGLKFVFEKIKFLHCKKNFALYSTISFVNAQGSVKIRLACSKTLLLAISNSNITAHSNGYIKDDKYFFFIKVGAANVLLKLNYLQSRVETQYRKIIFITPSNIKHFIERSSVTY